MVIFKLYSKYDTDYTIIKNRLTESSYLRDKMCFFKNKYKKATLKLVLNFKVALIKRV